MGTGEQAILYTPSDREAMAREASIIKEIRYGESDYEQFLRKSLLRPALFTQARSCRARTAFSSALSAAWYSFSPICGLAADGMPITPSSECSFIFT